MNQKKTLDDVKINEINLEEIKKFLPYKENDEDKLKRK